MKRAPFWAVWRLELGYQLSRPMTWLLLLTVALMTWGLSTGTVQISSGSTSVGGTKVWLTSESSVAFYISMLVATLYSWFASISAGTVVLRDDEHKVGELLHSTPLSVRQYAWGKVLALTSAFLLVLLAQLVMMMVFFHLVPSAEADKLRGPFVLWNYLRPALVLGVPPLVVFIGVVFYLGVLTRRAAVAFLFPLVATTLSGFLLWNWAPAWLDPRLDRLLMALDPAGVRWLNRSWLDVDRGAEIYNTARLPFESWFLLSRVAMVAIGIGAVVLAQRRLARTLRGQVEAKAKRRRRQAPAPLPALTGARLRMSSQPPGWWRATRTIASVEAGSLLREPGLYLFAFFVLVQTVAGNLLQLGPFSTRLLLTSGQLAVGSFNTLALLVSLLLMFFLVESLDRERSGGAAPLVSSSPLPTPAILLGKVLGNSGVVLLVLLAVMMAHWIALAIQGQTSFTLWPYLLVWGLLLLPTFLAWSALIAALHGLFGSRYLTWAVGFAIIAYTLYRQLTGQMEWAFNWWLWGALQWSDISLFEFDRRALILNRLTVLAAAVLFSLLAVRFYRRRQLDIAGLMVRLRPRPLSRVVVGLLPAILPLLVTAGMLWVGVLHGSQGEVAEQQSKDYWKQNRETWIEALQPSYSAIDLQLDLRPAEGWLKSRGSYRLYNPHNQPIDRFALTGGPHWRQVSWTLDGVEQTPDERSGLYVFELAEPLAPAAELELGLTFEGHFPDGMSKNGGGGNQFVLASGVVLTSFGTAFMPQLGYLEDIGVDEDNRTDPADWKSDLYLESLPPALGNRRPYSTRVTISGPAELTYNSVGVKRRDEVAAGRRTVEWVSDHPVRFFNVVAGRWRERQGEGTVIHYHADHAYNIDAMSETLDAARRYYSQWFYPYPWQELKLSEFADLATYAQGFPTNITFSEGIGFLTLSEDRADAVRMVTAHEAAHQWWGNILTPGEGPGGAMLSEGMAHFSTILLLQQLAGDSSRMGFLKLIEKRYGERRRADDERPLVQIDGRLSGDQTVTYDKGGWVMWMLLHEMGREPLLAGLGEFIARYENGPDYPLLEDLLEVLRPHAADAGAFDRFTAQWFFDVVVPEFRIQEATVEKTAVGWRTRLVVESVGGGQLPITVAVSSGQRFDHDGQPDPSYHDARVRVDLGPGYVRELLIDSDFEPQRVVIDPDVEVLQLRRELAVLEF